MLYVNEYGKSSLTPRHDVLPFFHQNERVHIMLLRSLRTQIEHKELQYNITLLPSLSASQYRVNS